MSPPLPASILASIPVARGPGMNADEADAMMQSLAFHRSALSKDVLRILESIKGEEDVEDITITNREVLIKIAHLVTGQWGRYSTPEQGKARQNFIERMQELAASLDYLISEVEKTKKYSDSFRVDKKTGKKVKTGVILNPWLRGLEGGKPGGLIICKKAVDYLLTEGVYRRTIFRNGKPFGLAWGILAQGNGKLPFMAYSELPMATCPGAGDCAVYPKSVKNTAGGWCYSFKAWRYPDAFARQFLNTLANVADDALAKLRGGTPLERINPRGKMIDPSKRSKYDKYLPPGRRIWPEYVKWLLLFKTKGKRQGDTPMFLRLFVDGDMRDPGSVKEWMRVCRSMEPGSPAVKAYKAKAHVEVYGYSKAWHLFNQNLTWPKNYTLNMSGGSIWEGNAKARARMESLPITRGYFVATNLHGAMEEFVGKFTQRNLTDKMTDTQALARIKTFAQINEFNSASDVWAAANTLAAQLGIEAPTKKQQKKDGDQSVMDARAALFTNWINSLVNDKKVTDEAAMEIVADRAKSFAEFRKMSTAEKKKKAGQIPRSGKAMRDKVIAMHLHEVLWAFGAGGSCPLVCGNCFDDLTPSEHSVHRCASKPGRLFGRTADGRLGATIHIGLH